MSGYSPLPRGTTATLFTSALSTSVLLSLALWVALMPLAPTVAALDCAVPGSYATVQAAVDDLSCDTVNIAAGAFTNTVNITRSITLNGAGQEVTELGGEVDRRVLSISGDGIEVRVNDLSVINGDATNALPHLGGSGATRIGGGIAVYDGATLWLENVTVSNNVARGQGSGSGRGGGIGVYTATLHATNVMVHGNRADTAAGSGFGGGIAIIDGSAYITDAQIFENSGNIAGSNNGSGGGIYLGSNNADPAPHTVSLSLVESEVYSNSASETEGIAIGGGLGIGEEVSADVFLRNNEWRGNVALGSGALLGNGLGGAIGVSLPAAANHAHLTIVGDDFYHNAASIVEDLPNGTEARGGAVYLSSNSTGVLTATLTNVSIYENIAQLGSSSTTVGQGGALRADNAVVSIDSSVIYSNVAAFNGTGQGGAFRLENTAFTLDGSIVRNNLSNNGAAIYSTNQVDAAGQVNLTNSWIVNNFGSWAIRLNHSNPAVRDSFRHVTLVSPPISPTLGLEVLSGNVDMTNTIIASYTLGISNTGGVVAEAYNLFANNSTNIAGAVSSSDPVTGDPRFIDPTSNNYHIQTISAAVDQGIALGVLTDIDGDLRDSSPDVGADELNDEITGLSISAPSTVTVNIAIALSAQISTGTDVNYSWNFDGAGGGNTQSVNHTFVTTGSHEVTVMAANILGSLIATKTIEVVDALPPVTGLTAGNDGPTQVNNATSFSAAVTGGTNISYNWDYGDGSNDNGSGIAPTHTYTQPGVYTATVTASNATNSMSATTTVYVGDVIVEVFNNRYEPTDATVPVGGKVVWVLREGTHSVTADDGSFEQPAGSDWPPFIHTFNAAESNAFSAAATYSYHCSVHGLSMAGSVTVQEPPPPVAGLAADNDGPAKVNTPIGFTTTVTGGTGISYTWTFGDGSNGSGITTTHSYMQSGIYTATVVAANDTNSLTATTTVYVGDAVVEVINNSFEPDAVTIPAGGKVVWVRREGFHSVTADDGSFEQPVGSDWDSFIHTFSAGGSYPYYCTAHGAPGGVGMAGTVIVDAQLDVRLPIIRLRD